MKKRKKDLPAGQDIPVSTEEWPSLALSFIGLRFKGKGDIPGSRNEAKAGFKPFYLLSSLENFDLLEKLSRAEGDLKK